MSRAFINLTTALCVVSSVGCGSTDSAPDTGNPGDTGLIDDVARGDVALSFPLDRRDLFDTVVGFDHDPVVQEAGFDQLICVDYLGRGFPHCYDEHDGSDYILKGSWDTMDSGSATIIAAAPGVVIYAEDGHYDRCHGSTETLSNDCDGHDGVANAVIIEHEGGWQTLYWHMMRDSVAVAVGDTVQMGDALGLVGSSGNSSQPHLHFELNSADGDAIDPYAGPYSQPETWWCVQGEEDDLPGDCPSS